MVSKYVSFKVIEWEQINRSLPIEKEVRRVLGQRYLSDVQTRERFTDILRPNTSEMFIVADLQELDHDAVSVRLIWKGRHIITRWLPDYLQSQFSMLTKRLARS